MANSKAIGVAYSDQNLDGTTVGATITSYALQGCTINGSVMGATATNTVGFFGVTPAAQPTTSLEAAVSSVAPVSISATQWGFGTSTQAAAVLTLVNQLRADLVTLGIIKGS